jgi:hypothetical protein
MQETLASLLALGARPDESREIEEDRRYLSNRSLDDLPPEPEQTELDSWDRRREDLVLCVLFKTPSDRKEVQSACRVVGIDVSLVRTAIVGMKYPP